MSSSPSVNNCLQVEQNKKRKLQNEVGLPLAKHKYGDRSATLNHEIKEIDGSVQSEESINDRNSDVGGCEPLEEFRCGGPPSASSSCNNNAFKDMIYSLDSRSMKEVNSKDNMLEIYREEALIQEEYPGFGLYGDYAAELEANRMKDEEFDAEADDLMLYSNEVTAADFVLSSGRWSLKQDGAAGATTKPTIDQEFEQYFSMLML